MKSKNYNTDFWIGRTVMIFLFLTVLSFSNGGSNSQNSSDSFSIEQIIDIDNSAILVESVGYSLFDNSLANCELFNLKDCGTKLGADLSNHIINRQIKLQELKFHFIKPRLLRYCVIQLKSSSSEDYPFIS